LKDKTVLNTQLTVENTKLTDFLVNIQEEINILKHVTDKQHFDKTKLE
jgi:hypothetical protein